MSKVKKVTEKQVEFWLGSDWSVDDTIELLTAIANGEYLLEMFNEDVRSLLDE